MECKWQIKFYSRIVMFSHPLRYDIRVLAKIDFAAFRFGQNANFESPISARTLMKQEAPHGHII
jgi:hypothetical protein